MPFGNSRSRSQIFNTRVGTGTDEDSIHVEIGKLLSGFQAHVLKSPSGCLLFHFIFEVAGEGIGAVTEIT